MLKILKIMDNKNKHWIINTMYNDSEQIIHIQPDEGFDSIMLWFTEIDGSHNSGNLYITKNDLPILISRLQDTMNYINQK